MSSNTIGRSKIRRDESPELKRSNIEKQLEVFALDWQLKKAAVAMTVVRYRDSILLGIVHVLGRSIEDATWAQPRLAVVAGLTQLDKTLIQGSGWRSMLNMGGGRGGRLS